MNEAAREAEERRPGTCHHEAAHAVFAYHAGAPIEYVTVGEQPEAMSFFRYRRGDPNTTALAAARVLAGKYGEELAATGKAREHVPFEKLRERFEEALRTNKAPEDFEMDEIQAYSILMTMGRTNVTGVYRRACVYTAEHVERWWDEIDALATHLKEIGYLDGAEVVRVIRSVSGEVT
jgi:hypothetical protein